MSDETSNPPRTYLPRVKSSCRPSAELAHALRIDANNLAVKDGVLDRQLGERPLEWLKSKVPLIGETSLHSPYWRYATARKPSCFSSKM